MKTHKFKNYLKLGIFLFGISFLLTNCEYDEEVQKPKATAKNQLPFKLNEKSFQELYKDPNFSRAINQITSKKIKGSALSSKTVMEEQYGFTIDSTTINELIFDSFISYTMLINRETSNPTFFENLVVVIDSTNTITASIVKYTLNSELIPCADDSFILDAEIEFILIDYNTTQAKSNVPCLSVLMCPYGGDHPATSVCLAEAIAGEPREFYQGYVGDCDGSYGFDSASTPTNSGTTTGSGGSSTTDPTDTSYDPTTDPSNLDNHGVPIITAPVFTEDEDTLASSVDPCQKIENLFTKYPNYRAKLVTLATKTSELVEHGLQIKKDTTPSITPIDIGIAGMIKPNPCNTKKYISIAHTHNSPANKTYSVFSHGDLAFMARSLYCNKIKTNEFVAFLMTADGTRYAMTIEKPSKLKKLHNYLYYVNKIDNLDILTIANTNDMFSRGKKYREKLDKYYFNTKDDPKIKVNSNSNSDDELAFLEMLKKHNLGVTLFEVNPTFTTFTKVSVNDSGVKIDEDCPTN